METNASESKTAVLERVGERIMHLVEELGAASVEESNWGYLLFALGMAHQACYENARPPAPPAAPPGNLDRLKCNHDRVYRAQVKRHGAVTGWRRGFDDGGYSMQTPELLLAAGDWLIVGGPKKGPVLAEMRGEDGSEWWESLQPDPDEPPAVGS